MHQTIICITETQYNEWTERLKVLGNQEIQLSTNHVIRQLKPIVYDKMSLWPINAFSHILSAVMLHFKIFTGYWTTCITIFYSLKTKEFCSDDDWQYVNYYSHQFKFIILFSKDFQKKSGF